ncbi:MAG TPA: hypothetical protein VFJ94_03090 [Intrasporangium sp.]|uniref:hypothetical protein n=1 Tax=Intrasporangium sp. TaxID=1925024 RepID=UPI002D769DBD|nr:hypothetical protein [Intrasporangium sp.]HET7397485.1 hypothetical protein [Intrasporangium sp.]
MSHGTVDTRTSTTATSRPPGPSLAGLVGVELRRLWWRRLTKVVLVAALAVIGIATFAVYQETKPETMAQRVADYNRMVADMKQQRDAMSAADRAQQRADCERQQAEQRKTDPAADFRCDQMFEPPTPAAFGLVNTDRGQLLRKLVQDSTFIFGFLAFLLGTSLVAAEFSSGSMSSWLTFQPRRLRVGTAKLAAATLGGAVIGTLAVALATLGVALVTALNPPGSDTAMSDAPVVAGDSVGASLVRVVVAVALGGLGGAAIAFLFRATAGVMGMVLGYAVVVEGFIANGLAGGRLKPWLVSLNIEAFVKHDATYFATVCDADGCRGTQLTNSYTHGWVYLLVLSVVGVAAGLTAFRRRDVS